MTATTRPAHPPLTPLETFVQRSNTLTILLLGYNRYSGLHPESSRAEVLVDSVEEVLAHALDILPLRMGPISDTDSAVTNTAA